MTTMDFDSNRIAEKKKMKRIEDTRMKKLISIILSLCLLLTFAAAKNAPAGQETAKKTAEEDLKPNPEESGDK